MLIIYIMFKLFLITKYRERETLVILRWEQGYNSQVGTGL